MDTEQLLEIVNCYPRFRQIAAGLQWVCTESENISFDLQYPFGCALTWVQFPAGYVGAQFAESYVQAVLTKMAYEEEWQPDFWQMPCAEREHCLTNGEKLYRVYMSYDDLRMQPVSGETLLQTICAYANKRKDPLRRPIRSALRNGQSVELGGCYSGDHSVLTVSEDIMILTDYGIWD